MFRCRACSRGPGCRPRRRWTPPSSANRADEDIVTGFAACWEAMAQDRLPGAAVDVGREY
ncbi:hypothetical protein ACFRQM_12780 [Streptomyces sp. NPDC056831]|uniref:hypothetical protein n=1 Tax=Streptomyces sp. NPDC056831 TaxID=3345954 RepID=UPI0036D0E45B